MLEIRWHGRGGQGAKTAAFLLGEALATTGKYVQAFPEYGPERTGAPVVAYNRVADQPIRLHAPVTHPRYVVVLDLTLASAVDLGAGVPDDGLILVNTGRAPAEVRERLGLDGRPVRVLTVDAARIAMATLKRNIPNTPMLGALVAATGLLPKESFLEAMRDNLQHKFRNRPQVVDANLEAIRQAYEEVSA
ncbi:2-oxoacid:acceptor oxidoreductase family protein [Geochorda subterranea]|uniref:2-oxoacid:acceptor oxidoreductase family protein n=1 Tax=Geochorda subterranea TaxID=3109564 RepID=A0ABZ1BP70_9FIRM|nr:2-oxoacid:acceptor oxidoreductase family protein [Limnochorda sp. LNt]WRP14621.1 2-oxoacid:acceptor oxidoreductase family protein [Limnochorda sp. LNt]